MTPHTREKLCRIWSERRERDIAVRIYYEVQEAGGCRIYNLLRVEELF